jgi:hypothetical protein
MAVRPVERPLFTCQKTGKDTKEGESLHFVRWKKGGKDLVFSIYIIMDGLISILGDDYDKLSSPDKIC